MSNLAARKSADEIGITDAELERISQLIHRTAGIALNSTKRELVRTRLANRIEHFGLQTLGQYIDLIEADPSRRELTVLANLLTTNETSFYRESAHFDFIRDAVAPSLAPGSSFWSAGCSSGAEAYTLAMVLTDATSPAQQVGLRILGTDINTQVLDVAKEGVFRGSQLRGLPPDKRRRFFTEEEGGAAVRARPEIGRWITWARMNLIARKWPLKGPFQGIFCRNVMIYFDAATRQDLVQRYERLLAPGGHLFIGSSESLGGLKHGLEYVQPSVYRKG